MPSRRHTLLYFTPLLLILLHGAGVEAASLITKPPMSVNATLGSVATFTCSEDRFKCLLRELQVVDPAVLKVENELTRSQIQNILEKLGVKNQYPVDIIEHHIIPQFKYWKSKSADLLSTYLVYARDNIGQPGVTEAELVPLLKDCVVVITKNHGPKQLSKETVHFSSEYGPGEDLEVMFPGVASKWSYISPIYLEKSSLSETTPALLAHSWRSFLDELGVKAELAVLASEERIQQGTPRWNELHNLLMQSPNSGSYTVRDYLCQEFEDVVSSVQSQTPEHQRSQMTKLVEYLDRHWDAKYGQYMSAQYYDGENKHHIGSIPSSFKLSLVHLPWLPSAPSQPSQAFAEKHLYQGCELFKNTHMVRNLLSIHVPYASPITTNLLQAIEIKSSISATEMIKFLHKWSQLCNRGVPFIASVEHMRQVYLYLKREWDQKQLEGASVRDHGIQDSLRADAVIFVPDQVPEGDCDREDASPVPGHFYTINQVCWKDPTSVLYRRQRNNESLPVGLVPKLLEPHYSQEGQNEIRQAFLSPQGPFGIDNEPMVGTLIDLLKYISSVSAEPDERSVSDYTSIVLRLAELCREQESMQDYVHKSLMHAKVFPTQTGKWVALEEGVFENNAPELAKHFRDVEQVNFLQWSKDYGFHSVDQRRDEQSQENLRQDFLTLCKIPHISSVMRTEVVPEGTSRPVDGLLRKLHHCVPLIQRFLATHLQEHYHFLQQTQMKEKLQDLKVLSTKALFRRYSIVHNGREIQAPTLASTQSCELEIKDGTATLYILNDNIEKPRCLVAALSKFFQSKTPDLKLERFLVLLVLDDVSAEEDKVAIAEDHNLKAPSKEDPIWVIPVVDSQSPHQGAKEVESEEEVDKKLSRGELLVANTGLKRWPPQAAINLASAQLQSSTSARDRSGDIIGEKAAKRKHISEPSMEEHTYAATTLTSQQSRPASAYTSAATTLTCQQSRPASAYKFLNHPPGLPCRQGSKVSSPWQPNLHSEFLVETSVVDVSSLMTAVSLEGMDIETQAMPVYKSRKHVGKWGEHFVFTYLKQAGELPDGQKIRKVEWVNEKNESGNPYDILVTVDGGSAYVEVKSTASASKELEAVSWKELKFAKEKSKRFYLFRVFSAGMASRQLHWLQDLHGCLESKPVRMFIVL